MKIFNKNYFTLIFLTLLVFITSCGPLAFKRADVKDSPINDADKRKKNVEEGRGATFKFGGNKSGNFDFASSNEMWRAAIEVLDFAPLVNADYGGGIIITDWYSEEMNQNESIKISVQFLSNDIRPDGIRVKIYKKVCDNKQNCKILKTNTSTNQEIKIAILKKAAAIKANVNKDG
jgi:hypothetical protein